MAHPDDLVIALAEAYGLSELVDLDGDRLRRQVEVAHQGLDGSGTVEIRVRPADLEVDGRSMEDPDGFVSEMARDLTFAGVREVHLPGDTSLESLLAFVRGLRNGAGRGRPDETGAAFADALPEIGVAFVEEAQERGSSREMGGLFGGPGGDDGPGEPETASAEAEVAPGEGSGRPEPGDVGEGDEEDGEDGEEEDAEELDPLVALARRYLDADAVGRRELAEELRRKADEASEPGEVGSVAAAVERLAVAAAGESGSSEWADLARELTTPGVAARLAARLAGVRDEEERSPVIRGLALLDEEMATAVGEALMDTSDRAARRAYIEALVAMGEPGIAEAEAMIEDDRWFVVRNGVSILGEAGGERAVEHLTSALGHDDSRVRREAVLALARVGGEDAGALVLGLVDDPDPEVREATARALGFLKVEKAVRPLLQRLDQEGEEDVETQIIRALGALGDPGAVPSIEKRAVASFFSRPSQPLRIAAYKALSDIGTPHAMGLVESAAEDKDPEVRDLARSILESRGA